MSIPTQNLKIKELSIDKIPPSTSNYTDSSQGGSKIVVIGKPGCFTKGTGILMYDGTIKNVENVNVGDKIMGDDSTVRNVLELCYNNDMMYKITPVDGGESYTVNETHILSLKNIVSDQTVDMVLKDFLQESDSFKNDHLWYRTSAEFAEQQYSIDPYFIGYWLVFNDTINNISNIIPNDIAYHFFDYLRDNSLMKNNEKYIPDLYKINSSNVRLRLLSGIVDSSGLYNYEENTINVSLNSEKLCNDIIFLAKSLGLFAYKKLYISKKINNNKEHEITYSCFITGNLYIINSAILKDVFQKRAKTPYNSYITTKFTIISYKIW
jgi:replicative DNA helicase